MSQGELTRQKSYLLRQRYQQLEEKLRPQRPVMLPSVRSFSYEMPTQVAEIEAMMRAQSSSPTALPRAASTAPPCPLHQELP